MIYVGLDMSLRSPGMCVYDAEQKSMHLYGWKQRKKDNKFQPYHVESCTIEKPFTVSKFFVDLFPQIREDRWDAIVDIVGHIESVLEKLPVNKLRVAIEGYAHNMKQSSSMSVLSELGGALRYMLQRKNIYWEEVSPKTGKKDFGGTGNATKEDMIRKYIDYGFYCDFLDCSMTQHPNEDMVDSVGICTSIIKRYSGNPSRKPGLKRKKKKKKIPSFSKRPKL